jgi:hypothetical protein
MIGGLTVTSNVSAVLKRFRADVRDMPKAIERGLNRALERSNTLAARGIGKPSGRYNVRQAAVRKALKPARASAKGRRFEAVLKVQGARIPLIEFEARERTVTVTATRFGRKRRAVSVKVLRGGSRKDVLGAFMQMAGGSLAGRRALFKRVGPARYPIKFLRSVSIPRAFLHKSVLQPVQAGAIEAFRTNFLQQVKFMGQRRG